MNMSDYKVFISTIFKWSLNILLFLILSSNYLHSQPDLKKSVADSLNAKLESTNTPDSSRVKALLKYAWEGYLYHESDSSLLFANEAFETAQKSGLPHLAGEALNTKGAYHYVRGDFDAALKEYEACKEVYKEINDFTGMANTYNNIGLIHWNESSYLNAIEMYEKSLAIREQQNDMAGIATSLNNLGIIFMEQGNHKEAIKRFKNSLLLKQKNNLTKSIPATLKNIGTVYYYLEDYEQAIDFFSSCLALEKEQKNNKGIAETLNNLGNVSLEKGDTEKALNYYNESLEIENKIGNKRGIAICYNNIGNVYDKKGNKSEALNYFQKALIIEDEIGDKQGLSGSLNNIGNIYKSQGEFKTAEGYNIRALEIAKRVGAIEELKSAAMSLWEIYKSTNQYEKALEMHEMYTAARDSILSEENTTEIIHQEYRYEYKIQAISDSIAHQKEQVIKETEIRRQKAELEASKNKQYALFGGIFLLLVFGGFMYNRFKVTNRQKKLIEKQKKIVEEAHITLESKNNEIMDSIKYAERIQAAILPKEADVVKHIPNHFIFYKPKDIVAGDFYWFEKKGDAIFIAAADCTGHGVPGAMVSVFCNNGLNRAVREHNLTNPNDILDKTREIVIDEFKKSTEKVNDGMDISLVKIQQESTEQNRNILHWSGANCPIWIIRKGNLSELDFTGKINTKTSIFQQNEHTLFELKADKQSVGKNVTYTPFTSHIVNLKKGDTLYLFSDGFQDQFGGVEKSTIKKDGKKFKSKNLKKLLLDIQAQDMNQQKSTLQKAFESWKGDLEQVDDVCVIGVRI